MAAPRFLALLTLILPLGGCGSGPPPAQAPAADDPVMTAAIEGQLMVDPDLSQQNERNLAVRPPQPVDPALPGPE